MQEQNRNSSERQDGNLGRLKNNDPQKKNMQDISHVDQQEGNMQHGQTGGNFNSEEQKQNASTKEPERS